jgi:phage shock protein A
MHRHLDALLARSREKADAWLDEARALRTVAADVGGYAVDRLRDLQQGGRRAADPVETVLNQLVLELSYGLIEAKKAVAVSIADKHRLAKQTEQEHCSAAEWAARAARAEEMGDAALTAEARALSSEHAKHAEAVASLLSRQTADVDCLKQTLRAYNDRLDRAKRDRNRVIAQRRLARSNEVLRVEVRRLHEVVQLLDRLSTLTEPVEPVEVDDGGGQEPLH